MPGSDGHPRTIRFGAYELDEATHELRKNGLRIHLQDQPWQVLCALLERPGEVVSRNELRRRLWPDGTFVDYEKSLNKAVNKLRDALCDSAETPRYVQTASRRGYRFVAPVSVVSGVAPGFGQDEAPPARAGPPLVARPGRGRWIVAAVSSAVFLIAAVPLALNVGGLRDRLLMALDLKSATPPRIESIAVLPLQNLSHDPEQEYFTDGLTDMLIGDLGKMGTLRVISHTSVMQYKGTRKPLPQIARELNVDAVVEGTVLRSGSRIRITAQLLLARTDTHLWSDVYEREFEDAIRIEKQVALAIAHEVTGHLTPAQETRLARGRTTNPRAYDAYLHGRYLWNQRDTEHTAAAVGYFEQALREDPHFALAYSGLADSYSVSWWTRANLRAAEEYARKALAFEPDLAEAHASLGMVYAYTGRLADAEKELRRSIELNPNYVMAHHWWALNLVYFGHFEEALAENDRARQLDPFSLPVNNGRMYALVGLHRYDQAIEQCETLTGIDRAHSPPHGWLNRIYWLQGRVPEAIAEARADATLENSAARLRDLDQIAAAYSKSGLRAAQVKAAHVEERGYKSLYTPLNIAYRYGVAGNQDKVFEWLDRTCRDDFAECLTLRGAPEFDFVRSTPRFRELLRRQGLDR